MCTYTCVHTHACTSLIYYLKRKYTHTHTEEKCSIKKNLRNCSWHFRNVSVKVNCLL